MKTALITGLTGQDGSYLAEFLLEKGYNVRGIVRRSSSFNTSRIDHIIRKHPAGRFNWMRADMTDASSLLQVIAETKPDEVYNLAAQSHVKVSFELPYYTYDVCSTGVLRLLEAIRSSGLNPRIYQASSSEMFGGASPPQSESTRFNPASPYAVAKTAAHFLCANYRESYGMWVASGIMFNHESPRRGETFVTRKVTRAVARILLGIERRLIVGTLDSERDWGYAPEYIEMMWKMLQNTRPTDYVIATGEAHTVKEFIDLAFTEIGIELKWSGSGANAKAVAKEIGESDYGKARLTSGETVVQASSEYFRPVDPERLLGDAGKARKDLGWKPNTRFEKLVKLMVASDVRATRVLLEGTRKHNEEWREYLI
ncbi:MAG: GDP-mannose 4,6-dehydratase [Thaumarchaeota archaeon]|nr:GDP-mannose 4,6-dehydratase [Nitrososphaerota archaeon]